jgi:glycosyltransferase involved in cell wall biosynthesis
MPPDGGRTGLAPVTADGRAGAPLRVLLWSRNGAGLHYGGPGMQAYRLYTRPEMREAARVTLVHGRPELDAVPGFTRSVCLGPARVGSQRSVGSPLLSRSVGLVDTVRFLRRARSWIREHAADFDVFHGMQSRLLTIEPAMWARAAGLPAVVMITGRANQVRAPAGLSGTYLLGRRRARQLRSLDAVVSMSREITEELRGAGVRAERIVEIPWGVDVDAITPAGPAERARRRAALGLPDRPTVLFTGVLVRRKRPHLLVEAVARLAREGLDLQAVLLGPPPDPSYARRLRADAAAAGAADRLITPGFVTNVPDYLVAADVFCLPSRQEGLPTAGLEALAAGLPLVLTDFSGARDLGVGDGGTGVLVPPSAEGIAGAIRALLRDDAARAAAARAARDLAVRRFSIRAAAERHLELFRSLAR